MNRQPMCNWVVKPPFTQYIPKRDYRCIYTADTPLEQMVDDPRVAEILERYMPGFIAGLDRTDIETMSSSLSASRSRAALFQEPTGPFDKAINEISTLHIQQHEGGTL